MAKVVILMGSKSDLEHCKKMGKVLNEFGVDYVYHIASAHKVPEKALEIVRKYSAHGTVFITVAGMSNALSGFVDGEATAPVIACPPLSDKFAGLDILSSIRMPSGVCPLFILDPESAALAAVKILSLGDTTLVKKVANYKKNLQDILLKADSEVNETEN